MIQRYAFLRPADGVLVCHGFVETNSPGEIRIDVPEDFALEPLKWKFENEQWVAHQEPTP